MKILYAVQATGNGHLSRAREIIPILQKKGELDILISGTQADVELPFEIKYKFRGLSFVFGKKGGIDFLETYKKSSLKKLLVEIKSLPVEEYDVIINDFEPVSAWACKKKNKICIGLSHQSAVYDKNSPKAKKIDPVGNLVLKNYAPVTKTYGFHFQSYGKNIFTPVIRSEIREAKISNYKHYTVYLPAYGEAQIIKVLSKIDNINWQVFCKETKKTKNYANIKMIPVDNDKFIKSIVKAEGIICGAGFETPAEALFLKKKLLVIPMKGQYEQHCNASALKKMGVPVIKSLKKKNIPSILKWVKTNSIVEVDYIDETEKIIDFILQNDVLNTKNKYFTVQKTGLSLKKYRKKSIHQITSF